MTDQAGHGDFEELAAGYALHALEPTDEQRLLRHAAQCTGCTRSIAAFLDVAAVLAEVTPGAEPDRQLGQRILAAARTAPRLAPGPGLNGQHAAPVAGKAGMLSAGGAASDRLGPRAAAPRHAATPESHSRPRRLRRAAAGVAAALIGVGGIWAGLAISRGGPAAPPPGCAHLRGCSEVTLTTAKTGQAVAKVIVSDKLAWLAPTRMPPDDQADQIYVLWQITGARTLAVGSFDVRAGTTALIKVGDLAAPYSGTWAFAISLEHGRTIPATPSRAMALGQVS